VALALSLGLALAALAAPAGASDVDPTRVSGTAKRSLHVWAYFDGDTPISGARVRVYAGGHQLRELDAGPGPARTFPGGMALLRFSSLPDRIRLVVSGGRAGGRPVHGSLKANVRGVGNGEVVHVNPVTTVADALARAGEKRSHGQARDVIERTLGIRQILDDHDLYATDQWFDGDRFHRWTLRLGSVGAAVRELSRQIGQPGFDRRTFDPADGGDPGARAGGGATAATHINGLLDALAGAAALTGPQGFAVGALMVFVKEVINNGLGGSGQDDVSAKLQELSAQITQLQNQIDKKFFELQIRDTEKMVTDIEETQAKFVTALKWSTAAANQNLPASEREAARNALPNSMTNFMRAARNLVDQNVGAQLHKALTAQQGGTAQNPATAPALIPTIRREIGKEPFFTNESSRRLQQFFRYYEWAQTELATILSEYYLLGGPCFLDTNVAGCPNPSKPDPLNAAAEVRRIQENIAAQARAMPPSILDPGAFIDTRTNLMWAVEPQYRPAALIPGLGIRCLAQAPISRECVSAVLNSYPNPNQFGNVVPLTLPGVSGSATWSVPAAKQLQNLLAQRGGGEDPVAWLKKTFGVNFEQRKVPPSSVDRFPGYNPDKLTHRIALWSRDRFQISYTRRHIFDEWQMTPAADLLLLVPCQGGRCLRRLRNLQPLDFDELEVAHGCQDPGFLRPDLLTGRRCIAEPSTGGFILWLRDTTPTERAQYW
jgi:hypothetical protein